MRFTLTARTHPRSPSCPGRSSNQSNFRNRLPQSWSGCWGFDSKMGTSDCDKDSTTVKGASTPPRKSSCLIVSSSNTLMSTFCSRLYMKKSLRSVSFHCGSQFLATVEDRQHSSAIVTWTYGSLVALPRARQSLPTRPCARSAVTRNTPWGSGRLTSVRSTPCCSVPMGVPITLGSTTDLAIAELMAPRKAPAMPGMSAMFPMPVKLRSSFGQSRKETETPPMTGTSSMSCENQTSSSPLSRTSLMPMLPTGVEISMFTSDW
mmetsp:Transcript_4500/g.12683  ORF Transcript_4500/g.12683 Transcript_4500/m.12683 type:complete len:262 (+) Transcript_4500:598-1383(+)